MSLLHVARDGMIAQAAGIQTTGQNISNVNTPGYVRRRALLETRALGRGGDGTVNVAGIARGFDRFSYGRMVVEQGRRGAADARATALLRMENTLAPTSGGIAERLSDFFSAVQDLSAQPSDPSTRAAVVARAIGVAEGIAGAASDLAQQRTDLLSSARSVAGEVNERLSRVAVLNRQIAEAHGLGDDAHDLRDQRDQLVSEIGERVGVRAIEDDHGAVTLFSAGTVLVESTYARSLEVDVNGAGDLRVLVHQPGGGVDDVTAGVTSGTLGGVREARDVDLAAQTTALDQFAYDLTTRLNAQHAAGVGLDGVGGRVMFNAPTTVAGAAYAMRVDPGLAADPRRLGAARNAADLPGGNDNAVAMAALATAPLGSAASPAARIAQIAADVGARSASAAAETELRADTFVQAQHAFESASGVSVDEEMVELSRFQRAFEASVKVLRTADELLANLMRELA